MRRRTASLLAGLLLLGTLLLGSATAFAGEGVDIPGGPSEPKPGSGVVDLLEPAKGFLSSSAWLVAEGIDRRLWLDRPGWSGLTRLEWGKLGGGMLRGAGAPSAQAGPGGLVPFRDPAPAFSRNIMVTRDFGEFPFQTEPHITVNPNDPEHLIVGSIDYNFPNNSAYVSFDGGATWEGPRQLPFLRNDDVSAGDPVVGFDRDGNAYFASISLGTEEYSVGPLVDFATVSSIIVSRSTDGGLNWGEPVSAARSQVTSEVSLDEEGRVRGDLITGFLDKPWMTIGPDPENPDEDVIYITYTRFVLRNEIFYIGELPFLGLPEMQTTIRMVKSTDGGRTWSDPVDVSPTVRTVFGEGPGSPDTPTQASGTKRGVQGSYPAVAEDGTLYVAWMDTTDDDSMKGLGEIYVARSEDAGETFERTRVTSFNEVGFRPRNAFFRFWGTSFPRMAVGPDETLYVTYGGRPSDKEKDDADIYVARSTDEGRTWERPQRINQDKGDAVQFFPAITTGPEGTVHLMWADMRNDPREEIRYHIFYTRSTDGGETWGFENPERNISSPDTRVTDFGSNSLKGFPSGVFLGDYFGIAASEEDVYMAWADTRLGEFGAPNQKISFARKEAVPSPEIVLNPPVGAGGRDVTIQGFGFQPESEALIQVGGTIVSTERTNDQGRFTTSLFMPLSAEGSHDVSAFDESGNRASASFFTEFGFDTVKKKQESLEEGLRSLREELQSQGRASGQASAEDGGDTGESNVRTGNGSAGAGDDSAASGDASRQLAALREAIEGQQGNDGGASLWVVAAVALGSAVLGGAVAGGVAGVARRRRA